MPVHSCCLSVINLHAIHAHVLLTGFGIFRDNERQRNKTPSVIRPALKNGIIKERAVFFNNLLAGCFPDDLRLCGSQFIELIECFHFLAKPEIGFYF